MSDLLEPLAKAEEDQREAQSTEELMLAIEDANIKMKDKKIKQCVVGSMDVESLSKLGSESFC